MKTKIHPSCLLPLLVLLLSSCLGLTRPEGEEKRVSDDHLMIKEVFSSGTYTPDVKSVSYTHLTLPTILLV